MPGRYQQKLTASHSSYSDHKAIQTAGIIHVGEYTVVIKAVEMSENPFFLSFLSPRLVSYFRRLDTTFGGQFCQK
jgi:hypothetical protein